MYYAHGFEKKNTYKDCVRTSTHVWKKYLDQLRSPQQYRRHINPWKKCSNLMQFLKYLAEPFSRSLRSLRSKDVRC